MTSYAWDVPGYVQGHRFSNDPRYFDSVAGRFGDRAGYNHLGNHVQLVAGTPAFSAHGANSRVGLLLNNSNICKFHPVVAWEGSMLFVFKPTRVTAISPQYPWLFGNVTTETSNGTIRLNASGSPAVPQFSVATPSLRIQLTITGLTSGNIAICAFSLNQSDRFGRSTQDGVTITTTAAPAGTNGDALALGSGSVPGVVADIGGISQDYVRLGDMVGDGGLTPNATDYLHLFEQHFWKGDVLRDNAPKLAAFITSLRAYYGI